MRTLYVIAKGIWQGVKWIWTAIIIAILVSVAAAIIPGETDKVVRSVAATIIFWFRMFGPIQQITVGGIVFLTLLALTSGLITVIFKSYEPKYAPPPEVQAVFDYIKKDMEAKTQKEALLQEKKKEAFKQYLHAVGETNTSIRPRGFAHISQALVFIDLPQDETFVDLQAVADEPVYDAPGEQRRQLEAMRHRADLSNEEREAYLQRLHVIWHSQLRWDVNEEEAQPPLLLTEILQRFTSTTPVAILLGTPGSGKTTYLHCLALHMARA
jgi:hypothetical protein